MPIVNTPKIDDNLLYRRQFFFAPRYIENLPGWKKIQVSKKYFLTIHPDLNHIHLMKDDVEIFSLGFILDPFNPQYSDKDIVQDLLNKSTEFSSIIKNTYNYGGRWIIIYKNKNNIQFFHDAAGSRQIFYTFHKTGVWCASQPHTIAKELKISKSNNPDLLEFINSKEFEEDEHCMIGDGTVYNNILHLVPNHSLSVNHTKVSRYWPDKPIPKLTMEKATEKVSELLVKLYESANNRFKLIQPVTAGTDSRVLLAVSKFESNDIFYFIHKFDKLTRFSPDIRVPKKYLPSIGLDFNIVVCDEYNKYFDDYLKKNVYMIQSKKKKVQHYNYFKYFQGYVLASCNINGMIRFPPYDGIDQDCKESDLAKLFNAKNKRYVISAIKKWLNSDLLNIIKTKNIYIKDLFYWEHRNANWIPMFQTELDIAIDEWNPFNCRNLIIYGCSLPSDNGKRRERTTLFKNICIKIWPETLSFPISPPDYFNAIYIKNRLKKFIYVFLKKLHLLSIVKKIKHVF